jgi:hypothetical protein
MVLDLLGYGVEVLFLVHKYCYSIVLPEVLKVGFNLFFYL